MKKNFLKCLYLFITIYVIGRLIFICVIFPLPRNTISFIHIVFLAVLGIIFFKKYKYEKTGTNIKDTVIKISEIAEKYPNVKEAVDTMTYTIYDNLPEGFKSSMGIMIDFNDYYLSAFYVDLQLLAKSWNLELDELTIFQKSACLIDALSSHQSCSGLDTSSWVFQTSHSKDTDEFKKMTSLNVELAIKSGLLFLGLSIGEINNMPECIKYIKIIIYRAIDYGTLGDATIISIIADFLEIFINKN